MVLLLRKLADGSVETEDGRVILYSVSRFLAEIRDGEVCFICGASPGTKQFSNEHVIPDWVLRGSGLHSSSIVLPNRAAFKYGRLVIPCCEDCNGRMAATFEVPISQAFGSAYEGVVNLARCDGGALLWHWLALIFLKLQLKHRELYWNVNRKLGKEKISDLYDWTQLHHIHSVARSFHTGATVDPEVYGSLLVYPASNVEGVEEFDFADLLPAASILIRIGGVIAIAVLNDSGFALSGLRGLIQKMTGPLTLIQGRELLASFVTGI